MPPTTPGDHLYMTTDLYGMADNNGIQTLLPNPHAIRGIIDLVRGQLPALALRGDIARAAIVMYRGHSSLATVRRSQFQRLVPQGAAPAVDYAAIQGLDRPIVGVPIFSWINPALGRHLAHGYIHHDTVKAAEALRTRPAQQLSYLVLHTAQQSYPWPFKIIPSGA